MTMKPAISALLLAASPEDRLFASADPLWRAAKRRFGPVLIAVLLLHATVIATFFLADRPDLKANLRDNEIPVEVVVAPPPPPPPPPPQEKKKEPEQKPTPEKQKYVADEKPAYDAPRTPSKETVKQQSQNDQTRTPNQAKPAPANEMKPVPEQTKPVQSAATESADQTMAPQNLDNKLDAEPLDKAAPITSNRSKQKARQAKSRSALPDDEREAVSRQLASLMQAPDYSVASEAKVSPVGGGTADMRYFTILYGLIMRQMHFPSDPQRHTVATAVVGFWIDESGNIIHQALLRASGYPEVDAAVMSAVRKAAPFPPPPPQERLDQQGLSLTAPVPPN